MFKIIFSYFLGVLIGTASSAIINRIFYSEEKRGWATLIVLFITFIILSILFIILNK